MQRATSEVQLRAFFLHSSLHSTFLQASIENLNKNYIRREFWNKSVSWRVAELGSEALCAVLLSIPAVRLILPNACVTKHVSVILKKETKIEHLDSGISLVTMLEKKSKATLKTLLL